VTSLGPNRFPVDTDEGNSDLIENPPSFLADQRDSLSVFNQPEALWRVRAGPVAGQRVGPFGEAKAVAHADAEGEGALH
jgi:hypothetical protein